DAVVIEIDSPIPITKEMNLIDLIGKREMSRFFQKTRLKETRPQANIELTIPELYSSLLDHIQTHGWFLGEQRNESIAFSDAAISWYDNIYSPMVQVIQEQKILSGFPNRTEADLYIWIMEHRWFLMKDNQADISMDDAARHFFESFAENPWRRFRSWLSKFHLFQKKEE
ncbi:MAG TPA: DUF4032 domain-containing protein, partial [Leptolinea sp.]